MRETRLINVNVYITNYTVTRLLGGLDKRTDRNGVRRTWTN